MDRRQRELRRRRRTRNRRLTALCIALLVILSVLLSVLLVRTQRKAAEQEEVAKALEAVVKERESARDEAEQERDALNDTVAVLEQSNQDNLDQIASLRKQLSAYEKGKTPDPDDAPAYQSKYPDLYAYTRLGSGSEKKTVYLTFDDGPSGNTLDILDVLDKYQVKATFFVVHKDQAKFQDLYQEIVKRGHTLAVHSYTHQYKQIYSSVDAFLSDFNKMYEFLEDSAGVRARFFRFPGGSKNSYNEEIYLDIINEMERRGFTYFDWNVDAGDAVGATKAEARKNVIDAVLDRSGVSVVLMHDASNKADIVSLLPEIIETLQKEGYTFKAITEDTRPVQFSRK